MFSENRDALNTGHDFYSPGPREGFLESFATAYDAGVKGTRESIYDSMSKSYTSQNAALRDAGEYNGPTLNVAEPGRLAEYYTGEVDQPRFNVNEVEEYDKKIVELRAKHPKLALLTTREMWEGVQRSYADTMQKDAMQPRTVLGSIGAFVGSSVAAVDPRYNLIGTLTAPLAPGRTALARVAGQAGVQGLAETVGELGTNRQARRMLGGDTSLSGTVERIGFAAVGGAAGQGVGEAIGAGLRAGKRWFTDAPGDPAPPIPERPALTEPDLTRLTPEQGLNVRLRDAGVLPERPTTLGDRIMSAREGDDVSHIVSRLEAWDGESPANVRPPSASRFTDELAAVDAAGRTVDDLAREVDPDTFRVYDKLAAQRAAVQSEIDAIMKVNTAVDPVEMQTVKAAVDDLTNRITDIKEQARVPGLSNRKLAKLDERVKQLEQERTAYMARTQHIDGPRVQAARAESIALDDKMRDLAVPIGRAYARARGEWKLDTNNKAHVNRMVIEGLSKLPDNAGGVRAPGGSDAASSASRSSGINIQVPDSIRPKLRPGFTTLDVVRTMAREEEKFVNDRLQIMRDSLEQVLALKDREITIPGTDIKLKAGSKIRMVLEDGSEKDMSIREILQDQLNTEHELKAVSTCSL